MYQKDNVMFERFSSNVLFQRIFYNFWNMHSIRKPEHVGIFNRKWRLCTGNPVSYSMTLNIISEIGQPHSLLSFHSLMTNDVNLLLCLYVFLIYFVCVWSIYSNLFSFFFFTWVVFWWSDPLYNLDRNLLTDIGFANIFF